MIRRREFEELKDLVDGMCAGMGTLNPEVKSVLYPGSICRTYKHVKLKAIVDLREKINLLFDYLKLEQVTEPERTYLRKKAKP